MKLTYKAIAMMAGYGVLVWRHNTERRYRWGQINSGGGSFVVDTCQSSFANEQEAYEDCCRVCGLVEFDNE